MADLRVLAVTSEPPWPLNAGGHIRTFHLLKSIAAASELRLICPVQSAQESAEMALRRAGIALTSVPVSARHAGSEVVRVAGAFLRGEPYAMYRRHYWAAVGRATRDLAAQWKPDVLYLDHLDSYVYADATAVPSTCRLVIDLHNVYSILAARSAEDASQPMHRWFLRQEARRLAGIEQRVAKSGATVFAVSAQEAAYFTRLGAHRVVTVPNGVDCPSYATLETGRHGPPVVIFVGSMAWTPNVSAARYLFTDVLPSIRRALPDARVKIIGRNPPAELLSLQQEGAEITGEVDDIKPYLAEASLLAVPLDSGGGTRLKILEAFAAGLPVVSTAIGIEGIEAVPNEHFELAERPAFADAVLRLLNNRDHAARLAGRARALVQQRYDWSAIGAAAVAEIRRANYADADRGVN